MTDAPTPSLDMSPEDQDRSLFWAASWAATRHRPWSLDRCRHDSVTAAALWIFHPAGTQKQIGSITAEQGQWRATALLNGSPFGQQYFPSLERALDYVDTMSRPFYQKR